MVAQRDDRAIPHYVTVVHSEKYWIDRARRNPADFITYITDGKEPPAKHHKEWLYYIFGSKSTRLNLIAPRGSAKTDTVKRAIAWYIGQKPWLNHFIGSVTVKQASNRLVDIRGMISHDLRYKNVFPWISVDNDRSNNQTEMNIWSSLWHDGTVLDYPTWRTMIMRYGESKGHTLSAAGITAGTIVGLRLTGLIVIDDPHDEDNSNTEDQRDKVENFVKKTLIPCITSDDAKICVIHTRWHENDLAGRLKEEKRRSGEPVWTTVDIPAEDDTRTISYWPEQRPIEMLRAIEEEVGEVVYKLMYLNDPHGLSSGDFTIDMLRRQLPDPLPEFKELYISVDLSYSVSLRADFVVFTAIARDHQKKFNVYVLDIERFKSGKIGEVVDKLEQFADMIFKVYGILTGILFQKVGGEPAYGMELQGRRVDMPVQYVPTKGDKGTRLKSVALVAQAGRLYVNIYMKYYHRMTHELIGFPADHDDIPDTLSLPFQLEDWQDRGYQKVELDYIESAYLL